MNQNIDRAWLKKMWRSWPDTIPLQPCPTAHPPLAWCCKNIRKLTRTRVFVLGKETLRKIAKQKMERKMERKTWPTALNKIIFISGKIVNMYFPDNPSVASPTPHAIKKVGVKKGWGFSEFTSRLPLNCTSWTTDIILVSVYPVHRGWEKRRIPFTYCIYSSLSQLMVLWVLIAKTCWQ